MRLGGGFSPAIGGRIGEGADKASIEVVRQGGGETVVSTFGHVTSVHVRRPGSAVFSSLVASHTHSPYPASADPASPTTLQVETAQARGK